MHKVREAMKSSEQHPMQGTVHVDEFVIGGKENGKIKGGEEGKEAGNRKRGKKVTGIETGIRGETLYIPRTLTKKLKTNAQPNIKFNAKISYKTNEKYQFETTRRDHAVGKNEPIKNGERIM